MSSSGPHLSLSDYIARHLNGEASAETAESAPSLYNPALKQAWTPIPHPEEIGPPALSGQRLNSLDVDMGAGLEQYLPTPLFRFRVMKKRLNGEISELRERLNKYQRLPDASLDLQVRIAAIQERIGLLEAHERQVSAELSDILSVSPWFYQLSQQQQGFQQAIGRVWDVVRHAIIRLMYGKAYETVEAGNVELQALNELFAERLKDTQSPNSELGQLLNRYEQTLHQLESASAQLKRPVPRK